MDVTGGEATVSGGKVKTLNVKTTNTTTDSARVTGGEVEAMNVQSGKAAVSGGTVGTLNMTTGTTTVSGGTITTELDMLNGTTNISGGTVAHLDMHNGTTTVSGGEVTTMDVTGGSATVSNNGDVTALNVTGGEATVSGGKVKTLNVETNNAETDSARVTGGEVEAMNVQSGKAAVSGGTVGTLNMTTGTTTVSGGTITTALTANGGTLNLTSGTANSVTVGGGTANLNGGTVNGMTVNGGEAAVSGGNVTDTMTVNSGTANLTSGTVNGMTVNGGTANVTGGTINTTLNVNGGTTELGAATLTDLIINGVDADVKLTVDLKDVDVALEKGTLDMNGKTATFDGAHELTVGTEHVVFDLDDDEPLGGRITVNGSNQLTYLPTATWTGHSGYYLAGWSLDTNPGSTYQAGTNAGVPLASADKINPQFRMYGDTDTGTTVDATVSGGGDTGGGSAGGGSGSTGGGSTGGGSGSTGGGSAGDTSGASTLSISGTKRGNTVTLKEISSADIEALDVDEEIKIDLSGSGAEVTSVALTKTTVENIAASEADALTIVLPNADVALDALALDSVSRQASGSTIQMTVLTGSAAERTMNTQQREAVAGLDNPFVVDATITSAGRTISSFAGGTASLTVSVGEANRVVVWYVDANGAKSEVASNYDGENVTFVAEHFSHYVIERMGRWFVDVATSDYYYDAVKWALARNITGGTGDDQFSPGLECTRAQMVTFLWRAAGSPKPASNTNPFIDVASNSYYYNAVLWAVENGITNGIGDGRFGPDVSCTRGQVVTFLLRAVGTALTETRDDPFTDVAEGAYYYNAVLWAVENGVTNGIGDGRFGPDAPCTRGQIVTFLYRAYQQNT